MDYAEASIVLGIEIHITGAVSYRCTNILQKLMPHFLASVEESCCEGIRIRHRLDMHRTIRTAMPVGVLPRTGLDALKDRLEARIVPSMTTRIGLLVEVALMPQNPYH